MDIERIVEELRAERARLDGIISALERLKGGDVPTEAPKRRGRKFMDKQGREEVSERMKRYWADRRATRSGGKTKEQRGDAASAAASGDNPDRGPDNATHVVAA